MNAAPVDSIDERFSVVQISDGYRGLFAKRSFKKGEVLERAPVVEFCNEVSQHYRETACGEKFFSWEVDKNNAILSYAVGCGFVMMCNHSQNPNAGVRKDFKSKIIELYALEDIAIGAEINLRYFWVKTF